MPTNFATQAIRDVLISHAETNLQQGLQRKEMLRFEYGGLQLANAITKQGLLTPSQIGQIQNLAPNQSITLDLYKDKAKGTNTQRQRRGTGSSEAARVTPTFFAGIQEGIDMSMCNNEVRQYGAEREDVRRRTAAAYKERLAIELPKALMNIAERANDQVINYIETNKQAVATTPDAGSFYTTHTNDENHIPAADHKSATNGLPLWLSRMQTEAKQNKFGRDGVPFLLRNYRTADKLNRYRELGQSNNFNAAQYLGQFADYEDEAITNVGEGVMYMIDSGSLAFYQQANSLWTNMPEFKNGQMVAGNDLWLEPITVGNDAIFPNLPSMTIEVKAYRGYQDNYSTYGTDESRIDFVENISLFVKFGMTKAYYSTSGKTPILKYVFDV